MISGIATLLGLLVFIGIVWWAYSKGRAKANADAAMLPFALPDEADDARNGNTRNTDGKQRQGDTHE